DSDRFNMHAQATYTWQGYPAFRNPPGSLVIASPPFLGFPGGGQGRSIGAAEPYAKIQRAFIRQTVNLEGEKENVPADINQFAGTQTSDRLVFTFGRLAPID